MLAGSGPYEVVIGSGLRDRVPEFIASALGSLPKRALEVRDTNAATHAGAALASAGVELTPCTVNPSEPAKSLETTERLLRAALDAKLDRADFIVGLGGGIVGDVAGFVAATYRRGVAFINRPTTLLAMVDASIGGKTGVNLTDESGRLLKNMVGSFHQPAIVIADLDTLTTLPARVFRAGLGECVKHALLGPVHHQPDALAWLERVAEDLREPRTLRELVERSVRLKAAVVAGDEREDPHAPDGRAALNLGHTYAHAMETIAGLRIRSDGAEATGLMHGEAVALGLVAACRASALAGLAESALERRVRVLLERLGLPDAVAGLPDDDELVARMGADKKVVAGRQRLVLPLPEGGARVVEGVNAQIVRGGWAAVRAGS